ncbi:MAG: peptidoglycan editing factor PgeF [Candidatus Gastranaerophilales bacterium]|nr:peptidoglycan editing factor PgeF [Candidatus Gastranaerophilales bacterium]
MFYFEKINNVNLYKSSLLDAQRFKHAFTTRENWDCTTSPASFSMGTAGNPELLGYVQDNRRKICEILGIKSENLVIPEQKHTDNIKIISSSNDDVSNCDGLITRERGLGLMLLFADCVPVIMYAPDKHVVSVIHAGWRGTAKAIVSKALNIFEKEFNASVEEIQAVIGPAIGKCCYPVAPEVGEELLSTVTKKSQDDLYTRSITNDNNLINIDLKGLNARQLMERGVKNIDMSDKCTSCTNTIFYSHRAEYGKTGRHAAVAGLM